MTFTLPLLASFSVGLVGLALSADSGFDWGTDDDEDYESPFGSDTNDISEDDESDAPTNDNPFAAASNDDPTPAPSSNSSPASAAPDGDPLATIADARGLCDEAMGILHDGDPDRAFDRLGVYRAFSPDEMTQLQREVERTRAVVADRYGNALDYRRIREDTADEVLARFVYLERFELHGLRWRFTFYRGPNGWTLNDVYFDDEIERLLD